MKPFLDACAARACSFDVTGWPELVGTSFAAPLKHRQGAAAAIARYW